MKFKRLIPFLAILCTLGLMVACGSDSKSDDNSSDNKSSSTSSGDKSSSKYVGTWTLTPTAGGNPMYVAFDKDGSARMGKSANNLYIKGSYSITSNGVTAEMTNPGVGKCKLVCLDEGSSLLADFIEYWHSPEKHIPFKATK